MWRSGFVGTLTHCAAVMARAEDTSGIGIDAESDLSLPADILPTLPARPSSPRSSGSPRAIRPGTGCCSAPRIPMLKT